MNSDPTMLSVHFTYLHFYLRQIESIMIEMERAVASGWDVEAALPGALRGLLSGFLQFCFPMRMRLSE